jgi:asparagine synthase (glutamine-hydrolysing)
VSALAGCYWFDAPARTDDLRPSTECARHRAGGPFRFWCSGPVALAYAGSDDDASQPHHDSISRLTAIVDGEIDNVAEVAAALDQAAESSACAVALAAYRRWGLDLGSHLLGDFVIVIYDQAAARLVCIRDPMGQRPLFYSEGSRGLVFGSEAQQVVRHPAVRAGINEAMVAEHLSDGPTTIRETLWRNVSRLPPAHALEVTVHGVRVQRYWDFDPETRVRHATAEGYAEEFHALFSRAVECRTRNAGRVGVLLSGGLDSSSIAGVAQAIGAKTACAPIHAFTATFPGRPCDETAYVDAVVRKWDLPSTKIDVVLSQRADLEAEAERYLDLPISPGSTAGLLRRRAASMGIRRLLTGCGGDDFFSGSPLGAMGMLRRGQLIGLARALVGPLLGGGTRRVLRPVLGARSPRRPWIRAELAARTRLEDRLRQCDVPPFPTREQRDIYRIVRGLPQVLGDEVEDRAAHATGVTQRHPFYDRRVAEFGLALPSSQRMRRGTHKVVVRRALRNYLPETVAARVDKAEFSFTYVEALAALGGERLFSRLRSADAGWVDGDVVRSMYTDLIGLYSRGSGAYIGLAGPLWMVAALEVWLDRQ